MKRVEAFKYAADLARTRGCAFEVVWEEFVGPKNPNTGDYRGSYNVRFEGDVQISGQPRGAEVIALIRHDGYTRVYDGGPSA